MNPFLYKTGQSTPTAFNDITSGANSGGGGCPGFTATTGWVRCMPLLACSDTGPPSCQRYHVLSPSCLQDPATGWGSPDFSVLKTVV